MKRFIKTSLLLLSAFGLLYSQDKHQPRPNGPENTLWKTAGVPFQTVMDINNVSIWTKADGWHPNTHLGVSAGTYPKGTTTWAWAAGWLFGGKVSDGKVPVVRVGGNLDRPGMQAGRILTDATGKVTGREDPGAPDVRIWRVRPDYETADLKDDAANFYDKAFKDVTSAEEEAVRTQYDKDWKEWPAPKGAPYTDVNNDGKYDPDVDIPGVLGAGQTIWTVANDLSESQSGQFYGSPPTGIEFQLTMWAYASSTPLNDVVFYRGRYIYKGMTTTPASATIDSMYIAKWADVDLGDWTDDFVGCDTTLNLGFAWNSKTLDAEFRALGLPAPSFGWDFLNGVARRTGNPADSAIVDFKWRKGYKYVLNKPLSGFIRGAAGVQDPPYPSGQYIQTLRWYSAMRGFQPNSAYPASVPFIDPITGQPSRYTVNGDPVRGTGWLDGKDIPPGDRRLSMVHGPFSLSLGDTAEVVLAFVGGVGSDNLSSITVMKFNDIFAQYAFDNLFELPSPPATPKTDIAELDAEIVLLWGDADRTALTETVEQKGFKFEGYNVYQFPTSDGRIKDAAKVATYDLENDVTTIVDQTIDPATGVVVGKPSQTGRNSGVAHFIKLTRDGFTNKPLVNGRDYYFAVTAYSYNGNPEAPFHSLESAPIVVRARPQSPKPGTRYTSASGDTVKVTRSAGGSEGNAIAFVVDPSKTTGHSYRVGFDNPFGTSVTWKVTDLTVNRVVITGQTNQSGNDQYPIVDGIMLKVIGPPVAGKSATVSPSADRWFSGTGYGEVLYSGGYLGATFPGGSTVKPGDYKPVELRFVTKTGYTDLNNNGKYDVGEPYTVPGTVTQNAFFYSGLTDASYEGFFNVPFTAWDVSNSSSPRQLNVVVYDPDKNKQWDLNSQINDPALPNGGDIRFNYVYVTASTYDVSGTKYDPTKPGGAGWMGTKNGVNEAYWVLWLSPRSGREPYGKNLTVNLVPYLSNSPTDVFTYVAPTIQSSPVLASADADLINVFPNPYYGFNLREKNRLEKFVTFSHLPRKATIRIFTLGATLVKTIVKDDDSQFITWDLRNQNNLPIASGIYIAHIELPDLGQSKILKMALVQEDQFLKIY